MLLPIRWCLWVIRRLWYAVLAFGAGLGIGVLLLLRQEQRSWGVLPADVRRELPGDDLIPVADIVDTRSLRIGAAPEQVWPWLVQMGYGRGGWYSYDQFDMDRPSAETILEEHQHLDEGDVVPTYPGGGFVARIVDPGRALVLYLDTELVQRQAEAAALDADEAAAPDKALPAGLRAAGTMGDMAMPEFRVTWAFVLEPEPGGSRLVERMRVWTGSGGTPQRLGLPLFGLGTFVMTRRHMLGLKERAERPAAGAATTASATDPALG